MESMADASHSPQDRESTQRGSNPGHASFDGRVLAGWLSMQSVYLVILRLELREGCFWSFVLLWQVGWGLGAKCDSFG